MKAAPSTSSRFIAKRPQKDTQHGFKVLEVCDASRVCSTLTAHLLSAMRLSKPIWTCFQRNQTGSEACYSQERSFCLREDSTAQQGSKAAIAREYRILGVDANCARRARDTRRRVTQRHMSPSKLQLGTHEEKQLLADFVTAVAR